MSHSLIIINFKFQSAVPRISQDANVTTAPKKLRVALFGSYYRGFHVLSELLQGPLQDQIELVGIATDNPDATFISRDQRVWQYPHTEAEATMVSSLAERHRVPLFHGRVKAPDFYDIFEQAWQPDYCIMATFGQRIDQRLFAYPSTGFFNLHPSDDTVWPSRYAGANPFSQLIRDGATYCVVTLHRVDDGFDTGERIAISDRIYIPPGASVTDMHKATSPVAALLVRTHLTRILTESTLAKASSHV
jgi:methionyl-tRNA formyltransferase